MRGGWAERTSSSQPQPAGPGLGRRRGLEGHAVGGGPAPLPVTSMALGSSSGPGQAQSPCRTILGSALVIGHLAGWGTARALGKRRNLGAESPEMGPAPPLLTWPSPASAIPPVNWLLLELFLELLWEQTGSQGRACVLACGVCTCAGMSGSVCVCVVARGQHFRVNPAALQPPGGSHCQVHAQLMEQGGSGKPGL